MTTTIKLSDETKAALEDEQAPNETFDETVARLLGRSAGKTWTREEIKQLAIEAVEEQTRRA